MSAYSNKLRQLEFVVGYHLLQAQRRFAAEANVAVTAFLHNDSVSATKSKVRKMKKV